MDRLGNFGEVDGNWPPSIERVSDRSYHRKLVGGLFFVDVLVSAYLLILTVLVSIKLFGGGPTGTVPHDVGVYWVLVAVLALLTCSMSWTARAEIRAGRAFALGIVLAALSSFPLIFGIVMLFMSN